MCRSSAVDALELERDVAAHDFLISSDAPAEHPAFEADRFRPIGYSFASTWGDRMSDGRPVVRRSWLVGLLILSVAFALLFMALRPVEPEAQGVQDPELTSALVAEMDTPFCAEVRSRQSSLSIGLGDAAKSEEAWRSLGAVAADPLADDLIRIANVYKAVLQEEPSPTVRLTPVTDAIEQACGVALPGGAVGTILQ